MLTPVLVLTPVQLDPWIVVSVVLLGFLGTGLAYIWNQNTVRAWGLTRASTITYITPLVDVVLGAVVLGERLSWNEPVGALVVFLGTLLAQDRLRRRNGSDEGTDAAAAGPSPPPDPSASAAGRRSAGSSAPQACMEISPAGARPGGRA